jgi:hypothetical protein
VNTVIEDSQSSPASQGLGVVILIVVIFVLFKLFDKNGWK